MSKKIPEFEYFVRMVDVDGEEYGENVASDYKKAMAIYNLMADNMRGDGVFRRIELVKRMYAKHKTKVIKSENFNTEADW